MYWYWQQYWHWYWREYMQPRLEPGLWQGDSCSLTETCSPQSPPWQWMGSPHHHETPVPWLTPVRYETSNFYSLKKLTSICEGGSPQSGTSTLPCSSSCPCLCLLSPFMLPAPTCALGIVCVKCFKDGINTLTSCEVEFTSDLACGSGAGDVNMLIWRFTRLKGRLLLFLPL